jgi:hypothetical protein
MLAHAKAVLKAIEQQIVDLHGKVLKLARIPRRPVCGSDPDL